MYEKSKSNEVVTQLCEDILIKKIYKPDDQLPSERELSERFGVSRTIIREAIKKLESKGILTVRAGSGTYVSSIPGLIGKNVNVSLDELDANIQRKLVADWYELRIVIGVAEMEAIVANANDVELQDLEKLLLDDQEIFDVSILEFQQQELAFHTALGRASHNTAFLEMESFLPASIYTLLNFENNPEFDKRNRINAAESHKMIVRFLNNRDTQGACMAMRYHMRTAISDFLNYYR